MTTHFPGGGYTDVTYGNGGPSRHRCGGCGAPIVSRHEAWLEALTFSAVCPGNTAESERRAMSAGTPDAGLVRMPNGVMDYLEHGADVVETAEAETRSASGDPETYERALARQQERLARPSSVHHMGTPILTRLFELLAEE